MEVLLEKFANEWDVIFLAINAWKIGNAASAWREQQTYLLSNGFAERDELLQLRCLLEECSHD